MTKGIVLVADEDEKKGQLLGLLLTRKGYDVLYTNDGREVMQIVKSVDISIILLEVKLCGINGFEVCKRLRLFTSVPIIFLTYNINEEDKVRGLDLGADDYVTKPFGINELAARIRANTRKRNVSLVQQEIMEYGDLYINFQDHVVRKRGIDIVLTAIEFRILSMLAHSPNRIFHPDLLYQLIWDKHNQKGSHIVKVHIRSIRKKIETDATIPQYIKTVRGVGYKFHQV
ncbi:response regulator transcription factor [Longirhabdus pacifica]|uniref:response regulator transcription factor n=1 Tax=Longirhabdus pacifica TaxID=2305227 RepID=UPI001008F359|nr:response regulator transcription factor [Longirhabdus pacifica]